MKAHTMQDTFGTDVERVFSRGCEYLFEHYESEDNGEGGAVVVTCWNRKDEIVFDGSTAWYKGERVLDVVRSAREAYKVRKAEYGY